VKFESIMDTQRARRFFHFRRFGTKLVQCHYLGEEKFVVRNFEIQTVIREENTMEGFEGLENCAIEFADGFETTVFQEQARNMTKPKLEDVIINFEGGHDAMVAAITIRPS
jgi:hypothetical protein